MSEAEKPHRQAAEPAADGTLNGEQSEEYFRRLAKNSLDMIFRMSVPDGNCQYLSPAALAVTGYSVEEIVAAPLFVGGLIHPDWRDFFEEQWANVLDGRVADSFEYQIIDKSGETRWLHQRNSLVSDKDGRPIALEGHVTDITDRKRSEQALQQSEERLRRIIEHSTNLFYSHTADHVLTYLSPQTREFFDCEPEEALRNWTDFCTDNPVNERGREITQRAIDTRERQPPFELELVDLKGRKIWVEVDEAPVVENGKTIAIVGAATNITERRQAEDALIKANENMTATLDALPDLLFEVDQKGRIYRFHAPSPDLLYAPAEVFLGKKISEVVPPEANETIMLALAEAAETGRHRGAIYQLDMPAGVGWYELSIAARGSEAPKNRFVVLIRDITERKRAEEEKLALEHQLQHTQKLESLGVLAGGIAHDFNNLLVGVLGNADLALASLPPGSTARSDIEGIITAAERAAELATHMLAYSGRGTLAVEPIDLSTLVEEMVNLLESTITKKVGLRLDLAKDLSSVEADATQLRQVIMNLIINGSEAIGEEVGSITVTTRERECDRQFLESTYVDDQLTEGSYVCLEVTDTGCGMDSETTGRIFDPFFTTKFTGRGLGLAALLGIVRGHNGAVKVESEPNSGTVVTVVFPASEKQLECAESSGDKAEPWQGKGTLLLVDDEVIVRKVAGKMLTKIGFDVLKASDGLEAVDVFREHADEIALVLLDMKMPRMDGEKAFEEIRSIRADAKVILSSGYTEEQVTKTFKGRGLTGFIQKPYRLAMLRTQLRGVLDAEAAETEH